MTPELQQAINELLMTIITILTSVVIPWTLKLARDWVKEKVSHIKEQNTREAIEFALNRLDFTAQTVTAQIRQQILKRDDAGKVTNGPSAAATAVGLVGDRIDPVSRATLEKLYPGDGLKKIIRSKVEQHAKTTVYTRC